MNPGPINPGPTNPAERLIGDLMLVSVLVAGEGAEALAAALADAGAAADAWQPGQAAEGFDLAILLAAPGSAHHAETRLLLDALAPASDRLLFAPTPLGQAASHASPALPELPSWFELFAELGYQPVVEFDASFVSAGAFLVDRAATAAEGDLAAFTDRIQLGADAASAQREAAAEAERSVRTDLQAVRAALSAREAELSESRAALSRMQSELADLTTRAARLAEAAQAAEAASREAEGRNAGWDGLRDWVRLEVADPGRNGLAALLRDLPRLNALRAPDLPEVAAPAAARRSWLGRLSRRRPSAGSAALDEAALIRNSPLFDAAWYIAANPGVSEGAALDPALHYVLVGGPSGSDPGPWFDTAAYLAEYPAAVGRCALVDAIRRGVAEPQQG